MRYQRKRYFRKSKKRFQGKRFKRYRSFKKPVRRFTRNITTSKERSLQIADRTYVKLTKQEFVTIATPAGSGFKAVYVSGNNYYVSGLDSDTTLPAGVFEWSQFYESGRILASRIKVTPVTTAASGAITPAWKLLQYGLAVFPIRYSSSTDVTRINVNNWLEQAYLKYRIINGNPDLQTITNMMSSKKMFAQRVTEEDDFQYNIQYVSGTPAVYNPSTVQWGWVIAFSPLVNAAVGEIDTLTVQLTVDYYVRLEDRITLESTSF